MIILRVKFTVKPDQLKEAIQAFIEMSKASEAETGCHGYEFTASMEDPHTIYLFEQWESAEALASHGQATHYKEFGKLMGTVLTVPPVIKRYTITTDGPLSI